jgi:hypothetical protein
VGREKKFENIIILQHDVHIAFGKMNLWFNPDEVPFIFGVAYIIS